MNDKKEKINSPEEFVKLFKAYFSNEVELVIKRQDIFSFKLFAIYVAADGKEKKTSRIFTLWSINAVISSGPGSLDRFMLQQALYMAQGLGTAAFLAEKFWTEELREQQ